MNEPSFRFFTTCIKGLESALAEELGAEDIGARNIRIGTSGVHFSGTLLTGYRACLWVRSGIRVLAELWTGHAQSPEQLYTWARQRDWSRWLDTNTTISVESRVWDSEITHSKYAALRIKDAICDYFRDLTGERPTVDPTHADLPLFLSLYKDRAVLYRDLSGTSLHKRGYRNVLHKSSLNESLAAGCILLSHWDRKSPLVDPMCGSGTFAIEAAMMARRIPPGLDRAMFPFQHWPDFDEKGWMACREQARSAILPDLPFKIAVNDRHAGALSLAQKDAAAAGVASQIDFSNEDAEAYQPGFTPLWVVSNPPWGERIDEGTEESWRKLGNFLKSQCDGATAWLLSGSVETTRHLRLRTSGKHPIRYGKIDCRLLKYEIQGRRNQPS